MLGHFALSHFFTGRRNQINQDAELYHQLPEDSPARKALLQSIEKRAQTYLEPRKLTAGITAPTTYFFLNLIMVLAVCGLIGYSAYEVHLEQKARATQVANFEEGFREATEQTRKSQELLEQISEGMREAEERASN